MLYFTIEKRLQDGIGKVPEVRDDDFIVGYRRIIVGYPRIAFLLAGEINGFSVDVLTSEFRGRRTIW